MPLGAIMLRGGAPICHKADAKLEVNEERPRQSWMTRPITYSTVDISPEEPGDCSGGDFVASLAVTIRPPACVNNMIRGPPEMWLANWTDG